MLVNFSRSNGTFLNDDLSSVDESELLDGDRIRAGDYIFIFLGGWETPAGPAGS